MEPFSLTGYINGCAIAFLRGHGLRFAERVVAKNDFDSAAANTHKHRLCLKDPRFTFCQRETFTGERRPAKLTIYLGGEISESEFRFK